MNQAYTPHSGPSHRRVEIGVAIGMMAFGLIVIAGSLQVGIGWGAEGPRSGFFPFYLGLIIIASSAVNLVQASLIYRGKLFAEWGQLRQVMSVVVPTTIYVFVLPCDRHLCLLDRADHLLHDVARALLRSISPAASPWR